MSCEHTERTKMGPGFDVYGIGTSENFVYPNDQEMEDTASSPVQVVGETVPESDVPSLGLTPQDSLSADRSHHGVILRICFPAELVLTMVRPIWGQPRPRLARGWRRCPPSPGRLCKRNFRCFQRHTRRSLTPISCAPFVHATFWQSFASDRFTGRVLALAE